MKTKKKLCSLVVASMKLFLFLILISSTASASTVQNSSSTGSYAYITNQGSGTVSVIDTATDTVKASIPVGDSPWGVAVTPDGSKVYVTNGEGGVNNTVSVIDTATNSVTATVTVGWGPVGVAVTPDGTKVYVANSYTDTVSVINTTTNTVTATVKVGGYPRGVAVTPDGTKVYVTNIEDNSFSVIDTKTDSVKETVPVDKLNYPYVKYTPQGITFSLDGTKAYMMASGTVCIIDTTNNTMIGKIKVSNEGGVAISPDGKKLYATNHWLLSNTVSVIDTATNSVTATMTVGWGPYGVAVTPDGTKVYVANSGSRNVSVINTATNTVTSTVNVGVYPIAFGQFICTPPVQPVYPVANFSTNVTIGNASLSVKFTDLSINANTVAWDFNGDGIADSIEKNPIHEFTLPGNYTVNLTTMNGNGTDSKFATINVIGKPAVLPVANFSSNVTTGNIPLSVQFTDLSENVTEWNWSFGDGSGSVEQNPAHTYSTAGNYTITLTANNSAGSNTVTKYSYITVVKPDETIIEGHAPLSVQFTDLSEDATSWKWNFGDESTSTEQNPTHTYSKPGQYTVTLTANNIAGSNLITKYSYIIVTNSTEAPIADFSVSTTSGKAPLNISFMDKSIGSLDSWNWSFGDGNTSTEQNPAHTYYNSGNYTVTLTANNSAGSSAVTKYSYIIITNSLKAPVADFSASITSGEAPLNVSY